MTSTILSGLVYEFLSVFNNTSAVCVCVQCRAREVLQLPIPFPGPCRASHQTFWVHFTAYVQHKPLFTKTTVTYNSRKLESLTRHETSSTVCFRMYSDHFSMCYSTVTLNCDLFTPNFKAFISVPYYIIVVSLVNI